MDLDSFVEGFAADREAAGFVLDFDGTLSPIVPDPAAARPLPGVTALLESLAGAYRTVTLVSGRRAAEVAGLVGARGVTYLGLYGLEEAGPGEPAPPPEHWRKAAAAFGAEAAAFLAAGGPAGCTVEDKGIGVSIHHRNAPDPGAGAVVLAWAAAHTPPGFVCGAGRMVVEVRPAGGSKDAAVERVVREAGLRWLVAAGDDAADVAALERAGELLGSRCLSVGVRSAEEPPGFARVCDLTVGSPHEVVALLGRFAAAAGV